MSDQPVRMMTLDEFIQNCKEHDIQPSINPTEEALRAELARVKQECASLHATVQDLAKANDTELQQAKEAGALSMADVAVAADVVIPETVTEMKDRLMSEWRKQEAGK